MGGNQLTVIDATANVSTTFEDLGLGDSSYVVHASNGNPIATVDVSKTTTLEQWFDSLESHGITGSISNGIITLESAEGKYITGAIPDALGIGTTTTTVDVGTTNSTSATPLTYQTTTSATQTGTTTSINSATSASAITYETVTTTTTTIGKTFTSSETIERQPMTVDASKRVANVSSFTSGQTYYISTGQDLKKLQTLVNNGASTSNVTFEVTNDIDMSSISYFYGIGTEEDTFSGTFNGNNYTISNLTIDSSEVKIGLFGYAAGSTIKNVVLENVEISGDNADSPIHAGGLAGRAQSSNIENCHVSGTLSLSEETNGNLGGLVGYNFYSTITNSSFKGRVDGGPGDTGGLVGYSSESTISNSFTSAIVYGGGWTGGFVGGVDDGVITRCYATGNVYNYELDTEDNYACGFIGAEYEYGRATINNCISNCCNTN